MKKRNLIVTLAALGAATIAMPAASQSKGFEPGFYIGAGLGQSMVSGGNGAVTVGGVTYTTTGFDDNKTTFQINGGYQFTEVWGIEVQYTDGGDRDGLVLGSDGTQRSVSGIKAYQFGIAGTGTFMFDEAWFARGKLGVSSNHIDDFSVSVPGGVVGVGGGSKTDLLAGIAIGYKWNKNFSTRLEYEYFGKFASANGSSSSGTASNVGLRMQYKF